MAPGSFTPKPGPFRTIRLGARPKAFRILSKTPAARIGSYVYRIQGIGEIRWSYAYFAYNKTAFKQARLEEVSNPKALPSEPEGWTSAALQQRRLHPKGQKQTQLRVMPPGGRCLTVQGSQMAHAMIGGQKPFEVRNIPLQPGWYYLHIGRKQLDPRCKSALSVTYPDAPAKCTDQFGCIMGQIRFGRALTTASLQHPWALSAFGPWCLLIEESVSLAGSENALRTRFRRTHQC